MKKEESKREATKKATISTLDVMIAHADKGPSGFWTGDQEGCGNPEIFPEFESGLKGGKSVNKEHYLCPWDTAVLYGGDRCNVFSGCYHHCSIRKAKFLSAEMLREVLARFKARLQNGEYDSFEQIVPLLTQEEMGFIEEQSHREETAREKRREAERKERLEKAAALMKKIPNFLNEDNKESLEDLENLFGLHYGEKALVRTYDGTIDFDPDGYKDVVGADKFTYDEYIAVQIRSFQKTRGWFETCFHNIPLGFKGCIERKSGDKICFQRILVEGMYPDGDCFVGREGHVWMDVSGFETFQEGDCVSFSAEIYRYVKTGNGKQIDFGLRKPQDIKKIEAYEIPSDEELIKQEIDGMVCETCYLEEHCNRVSCMRSKDEIQNTKKQLFDALKHNLDNADPQKGDGGCL